MGLKDISIIRGDNYSFNIVFTDLSGDPKDITGYTIWFTVRASIPKVTVENDDDATISKIYTNGDATGIIPVELTGTDTDLKIKTYKYDVQYKKPNGKVYSSGANDFTITADITRDK